MQLTSFIQETNKKIRKTHIYQKAVPTASTRCLEKKKNLCKSAPGGYWTTFPKAATTSRIKIIFFVKTKKIFLTSRNRFASEIFQIVYDRHEAGEQKKNKTIMGL